MPATRHRVVITRSSPTRTAPPRMRAGFELRRDGGRFVDGEAGLGVLLIHGQPGSPLVWTRIEPLLQARGLDVLTIERPDCPPRPPEDRSVADIAVQLDEAAALARLLDRRGHAPAVIVGHGFGAGTAVALAAAAPQCARALVLVAPALRSGVIPLCDQVMAVPALGPAVAWLGFRVAGLALHQPRLCRRLLHERAGLTGAQAEQVVRAFTRGTTWRRFTIERRQLRRDAQQLNRRLGEIQCPTFVIAGRNDHVVSYPIVSALAARLPDAQLVSTDTGHLIPIDDPQAVLDTVLRAHERAPEIPRRRDATSPTQPRK